MTQKYVWIDLQFDTGARKAAFERIRSQLTDAEARATLDALEKGFADAWYERLVQDNFLQFCDEMVHDIASSMPAPGDVFPNTRAAGNMARYWRWALFEDCMADTPYQVERVMQALVGSAFDAARREAALQSLMEKVP